MVKRPLGRSGLEIAPLVFGNHVFSIEVLNAASAKA